MRYFVTTLLAAACLAGALPAQGQIVNGDFEAGLSGWTSVSQAGSDGGWHLQTGNASPVNGIPVPSAPGGVTAAMSDAEGPGSHVLYQDFVSSTQVASAVLSFDVYVNNAAGDFHTPSTLDFATSELNQQGRIDLLLAGGDAFSLAPTDLLLNLHQTALGAPAESGYTRVEVDLTALLNAHQGTGLRLRLAEVDNVSMLLYGIDNLSLTVSPVPEPGMLSMLMAGMGLLAAWHWRGRRRPRPQRQ